MPNTAEGDFEKAKKFYPPWKSLWARTDPRADEAQIDDCVLEDAWRDAWNSGFQAGRTAGLREADEAGGNWQGGRFSG